MSRMRIFEPKYIKLTGGFWESVYWYEKIFQYVNITSQPREQYGNLRSESHNLIITRGIILLYISRRYSLNKSIYNLMKTNQLYK